MTTNSRNVQFSSEDGVALAGTLCSPASENVAGVMLFVHGITSDRSEWGIFDKLADRFAESLGIASLRFDYRSHGESEFPSSHFTLSGIQKDIEAAWAQLRANQTDPSRRFILGSSFGGGMAYRTACNLGQFERAFMLAPVFDYFEDIKRTAPKWKSELKSKGSFDYSVLKLGAAMVEEARSTVCIDSRSTLPITIFHGTNDDDVPIKSSSILANKYKVCELVPVPGAGHVMAAPGDLDMEDEASWRFIDLVAAEIEKRIARKT